VIIVSASGKENVGKENRGFVIFLSYIFLSAGLDGRNDDHGPKTLNDELRIFKLSGPHYQEVTDHDGRFWVEGAELGLGLWRGSYLNEDRLWLRWYDREGNWILTPAEQERKEKEAALRKAEQLAAKLRELGIDPDRV